MEQHIKTMVAGEFLYAKNGNLFTNFLRIWGNVPKGLRLKEKKMMGCTARTIVFGLREQNNPEIIEGIL